MNFVDLTGRKFGTLTVIRRDTDRPGVRWWCRCACGSERSYGGGNLRGGGSTNCGCQRRRTVTHGMSNSREHLSWMHAKRRCFNSRSPQYRHYGGRGITMCDRWANDFSGFYQDMGACPPGHSLDRIDVNGNYGPSNCRWADQEIQSNNQRRCVYITNNGETLTLAQWARRIGVHYQTIASRYRSNYPVHLLLSPQRGVTLAKVMEVSK